MPQPVSLTVMEIVALFSSALEQLHFNVTEPFSGVYFAAFERRLSSIFSMRILSNLSHKFDMPSSLVIKLIFFIVKEGFTVVMTELINSYEFNGSCLRVSFPFSILARSRVSLMRSKRESLAV